APPDRQARPAQGPVPGPAAGPDLRDGNQATREGPRRRGRDADRLRDDRRGARGAGDLEGQPGDQHDLRRARAREGPPRKRAEGAEDLSLLEGVAVSRGGHLPEPVLLQLLLARADADDHRRRGAPSETGPGDGGRADRSRLVDGGMVVTPR